MLTVDQLNLITAGVDGDLTGAEAECLCRLLDESSLARATYDQLRADSIRLQGLPRVQPPADLQARVMARVSALGRPAPSVPSRRAEPVQPTVRRARRQWVPVAVAASLLIGIAGASFLLFSGDRDNTSASHDPNRPPLGKNGAADPRWADWLPAANARLPSAPMPSERTGEGAVAPHSVIAPATTVAVAPPPRTPDRDLIGAHPRAEFPNFDLVQLRLPFLEPLAEFDRDAIRQQLVEELGREPAFRIDLFARNTLRGVELLQKAARGTGLTIHADNASMNFLRKGQVTSIVVYTDALNAAELTALLTRLNTEDARVSPRVFDAVHATPIGREDEVEIRRVLGADPGLFKRAIPAPDRRKEVLKGGSVSAGTADQIIDSIKAGKGAPVRDSAVLMTWSPSQGRTPPAMSAELKTYLSKRGERKPDAVPVIIVIRHGNG
jgi:hypothetical protein